METIESTVQKNIEIVRHRLIYLETKKCRKEMSKEQIDSSKKFATEMFRSLLTHRDKLKNDENYRIKCELYA